MSTKWTERDIPQQRGKVAIITGANSGIGYEAAVALARKGAHVILACRSAQRGQAALDKLTAEVAGASAAMMSLDLSDLSSVRAFAADFQSRHTQLHMLINNAGVMALPYQRTADGFEMQLGVNHLGHYALTGLLIAPLLNTPKSRVVNVSSQAHRMGVMRFDDLQSERSYQKWRAYGQSKLANLLFTLELDRRLTQAGADVLAVASHPGYSATNLQMVGPQAEGSTVMANIMRWANGSFLAMDARTGALTTLRAATDADMRGGDYIGPGGLMEFQGHPVRVKMNRRARNADDAARLWRASEELTGVAYLG